MDKDRIEDLHHFGILYKVDILESDVKKDADGQDSFGCQFYEIKNLHKKDLTPFAVEGLELLGYHLK